MTISHVSVAVRVLNGLQTKFVPILVVNHYKNTIISMNLNQFSI